MSRAVLRNVGSEADRSIAGDYMREIWESVVVQGSSPPKGMRPEVLRSWSRCREMGLDPFAEVAVPVVSEKEVSRLIEINKDLTGLSAPVMDMIEISVRDTGFMVSLSDRHGCVLMVKGGEEIMKMANRSNLRPGSLRDTDHAGTNAIAICLAEDKPVQLTGAEHYNIHFHPWTCSTAPIHGSGDTLLGAITLSGRSRSRHQHTLALVTAAAETIEGQIRERELAKEKSRLTSMLSLVFNSITDGVIAVDTGRRITHLNKRAAEMLGIKAESITGRILENELHPDQILLHAIETRDYFTGLEVSFGGPGGQRSFICSVDPIKDPPGHSIGAIISLAEKRQVISIAKRIGGNYAKYCFADIKGEDPELLRQMDLSRIAARTNSRVLITGESGTGKELFAQAIHAESRRSNEPFVAVSCATIPRDLIESELFGYRGGAFTGSRREGHVGKFELANKGTLFLDEVNSLPLDLQAKLLRVLQQNEILRLGDTRPLPVDVRVLAASNCDLMAEVEHGNFRKDLYYRLNVVEIVVPPLRSRMGDLELLIDHIMTRLSREMGVPKSRLSGEASEILKCHQWPGNIRELENCIERAFLLAQGRTIEKSHIPERTFRRTCQTLEGGHSLDQAYRAAVRTTLEECKGNVSMAAKRLRIARSTLYRKMREFGLDG